MDIGVTNIKARSLLRISVVVRIIRHAADIRNFTVIQVDIQADIQVDIQADIQADIHSDIYTDLELSPLINSGVLF